MIVVKVISFFFSPFCLFPFLSFFFFPLSLSSSRQATRYVALTSGNRKVIVHELPPLRSSLSPRLCACFDSIRSLALVFLRTGISTTRDRDPWNRRRLCVIEASIRGNERKKLVGDSRTRSVGRPDRARRSARKILRARRNLFHSVKYLNEESKFRLGGGRGKLEYFATARRQSQQRDRGEMCSKGRDRYPSRSTRHFSVSLYGLRLIKSFNI